MTAQDCDKAYGVEAAQIGHKTFVIHLLQKEIEEHLATCRHLDREKKKQDKKEEQEKHDNDVSDLPENGRDPSSPDSGGV